MASPTLSPTKQVSPWAIDAAEIMVQGTFEDPFRVSHGIGPSVDNVVFQLFNADCETEQPKDSPTAVINMVNETLFSDAASFDIVFDTELIPDDTGGFVTFNSGSSDAGSIDFCTRAISYEDDIEVAFRNTGISVLFDLTAVDFSLVSIAIEAEIEDTIITEVNTGFRVLACQCTDFTCDEDSAPIAQNNAFFVCIYPDHDDASLIPSVSIANFELTIFAGTGETLTEYTPVNFGVGGWDANSLTVVSEDPNSGIVEISTPIIATFYALNFEEVNVSGGAFLEFISAGGGRADTFVEYEMMFQLEILHQMGCFDRIINNVLGLF